jgi:peptidoglycan/xylan/chitin deacetylase (PgdA/CDA1 family)
MSLRSPPAWHALLLSLAAAGCLCSLRAATFQPGELITRGPQQDHRIALTFDDGPGPDTHRFLELLDRYGVKATFFVQGGRISERPEVLKPIAARGHEIASHTYAHTNYLTHLRQVAPGASDAEKQRRARADLVFDMNRTRTAIEQAAPVRIVLLRMPHGIDRPWIRDAARETGHILVNWTYGADWNPGTAEKLTPGYLKAIQPGAILLMHDGRNDGSKSLAIAESVIREARAQKYEMVTVSQLFGVQSPATPAPRPAPSTNTASSVRPAPAATQAQPPKRPH